MQQIKVQPKSEHKLCEIRYIATDYRLLILVQIFIKQILNKKCLNRQKRKQKIAP